jgi:hypothetical protein
MSPASPFNPPEIAISRRARSARSVASRDGFWHVGNRNRRRSNQTESIGKTRIRS